VSLVPNSIDHEHFSRKPRAKGQPPTVGFLFHPGGFKDIPTTIAALNRLIELKPDIRLRSFGAARPEKGQLPARTEFRYVPSQAEIARIYAECDAWLSTSRSEGFNLPPLEAMGSGCPAVCAKTGRPLEIIENGVNGYLVDEGDVEGFAQALARMLSLPDDEWVKMSEAAAAAVSHPTWEESNDLFEAALLQSLHRP